jgi:hypothetical protein
MALIGLKSFNVLDWKKCSVIAILIAISIMFSVVSVAMKDLNRETKGAKLLVLFAVFLLAFGYGWGLVTASNTFLSKAEPLIFRSEIIDKSSSGGKHRSWHLSLEPWGPVKTVSDVEVTQAVYKQVEAGQTVCINLYPGAWNIRWFSVSPCYLN